MSYPFYEKFQIKSKYLANWVSRSIKIDHETHKLGISEDGNQNFKFFPIQQLKMQQQNRKYLIIKTKDNRKYQIKGTKVLQLEQALYEQIIFQDFKNYKEKNSVHIPKKINYQSTQGSFTKSIQFQNEKVSFIQNQKKVVKRFTKQKSYLIQKDWKINEQSGGLVLISKEKKENQGKIIKFVLKKFITTGSFMGISFPVFAMKPQSILQTYCKSFSSAPLLFQNCQDSAIQRIKKFVSFVFAFSRLFSDMDKPFNPVIGETFQADVADGIFTAEQISHHPPLSAIHFEGKGYKIYCVLQLVAHIGVNSATGLFHGDITVQFNNNQKVSGRFLQGQMSGFVLGQNKFRPEQSCYAYDHKSKTVCTYHRQNKDIFKGYIGKLKNKSEVRFFQSILKSKSRFSDFKAFPKIQYEQIYSVVEACWSHYVNFDRRQYINFDDPYYLPFQPSHENIKLLKSDSRYRKDIQYLKQKQLELAQQQKEKIQNNQRYLAKLRNHKK